MPIQQTDQRLFKGTTAEILAFTPAAFDGWTYAESTDDNTAYRWNSTTGLWEPIGSSSSGVSPETYMAILYTPVDADVYLPGFATSAPAVAQWQVFPELPIIIDTARSITSMRVESTGSSTVNPLTVTVRKNGANTLNAILINAGTDTNVRSTNIVTFVAGDHWDVAVVGSGGGDVHLSIAVVWGP